MFPSTYEIVVFVHVAAAFVLVGSSLSAPLLRGAIRGAGSPEEVLQWVSFARRATRLNPAAAFIVLGTGIWLGASGWWSAGWFYVSIAIWLATSLLAILVVKRTEGLLAEAAGPDGSPGKIDSIRRAAGWDVATASMLANDIALLWIMMQKPSTGASLGVVAAANGIAIGVALAQRIASGRLGVAAREA